MFIIPVQKYCQSRGLQALGLFSRLLWQLKTIFPSIDSYFVTYVVNNNIIVVNPAFAIDKN
jgi:hypothetical protein